MSYNGSAEITQEQKAGFFTRRPSSTSVRNNGVTRAPQTTSLTLLVAFKNHPKDSV